MFLFPEASTRIRAGSRTASQTDGTTTAMQERWAQQGLSCDVWENFMQSTVFVRLDILF
jgi:hypothetical protein